MAPLAQTKISNPEVKMTDAEEVLCDAFFDLLDTVPVETRNGILSDLRANAEAHGE
jgi:hypothetical protein